ncbi:MAG TPA: DNA methyltransferase [Ktedonobacterales bacterium]|nr:DNA methyltransferase [Ktedonobacterales bacterium]
MPELIWNGKYDADGARHRPTLLTTTLRSVESGGFPPTEGGTVCDDAANQLILGETQWVLPALRADLAGQVSFIYIDPPFATGLDFTSNVLLPGATRPLTRTAYRDTWADLDSYLRWMDETLTLLRDLLANDGALLLHCDWRTEGALRLLLDDIFGAENFRNAIVWSYRSGGASRREALARKHDTILLYAMSPRFRIRPQTERQYLSKPFMGSRRDVSGRYYVDTLLRDVLEGEITCVDVDDETLMRYNVRPVLNLSRERLDYPTQKPLGLLRLLLTLASDPGNIVLDCCCGSGATALAAEELGRRWIAADASPLAIQTTRRRLLSLAAPRPFVVQRPSPPTPSPEEGGGHDLYGHADGDGFSEPTEVGAHLLLTIEQDGAAVTLRLVGYAPPLSSALPSREGESSSGLRLLDSWSVDWAYDGEIFRHCAHASRTRTGSQALATALTHTYTTPGVYTIAIHAVDLATHETVQTVSVTVAV